MNRTSRCDVIHSFWSHGSTVYIRSILCVGL